MENNTNNANNANNANNQDAADAHVRLLSTLSLRDVMSLLSVVITLTIAWGVFGTRLALLEREQVRLLAVIEKETEEKEQLKRRITHLEQQQQGDEFMIDQLYENAGLQTPKRRIPY